MSGSLFNPIDITLYLMPIFFLYFFSKGVNRHFKNQQLKIKLADLLVPYLMIGIQILSIQTFEVSIFPYFLILIFSLGIIIAVLIAYKKGEIIYSRFFKTYWRFVFMFSFLTYYLLVGANILNKIVSF
ncbi:MAG: DUF3397 domain-containing protein [Carnobacterium sp.]